MERTPRHPVTISLGTDYSVSTPPEHRTKTNQFNLPGMALSPEPALAPVDFRAYERMPAIDQDPYKGRDPRFARTRRFFLNLSLHSLEAEAEAAKADMLVAHHYTDRQTQAKSPELDTTRHPSWIKAQSYTLFWNGTVPNRLIRK